MHASPAGRPANGGRISLTYGKDVSRATHVVDAITAPRTENVTVSRALASNGRLGRPSTGFYLDRRRPVKRRRRRRRTVSSRRFPRNSYNFVVAINSNRSAVCLFVARASSSSYVAVIPALGSTDASLARPTASPQHRAHFVALAAAQSPRRLD